MAPTESNVQCLFLVKTSEVKTRQGAMWEVDGGRKWATKVQLQNSAYLLHDSKIMADLPRVSVFQAVKWEQM